MRSKRMRKPAKKSSVWRVGWGRGWDARPEAGARASGEERGNAAAPPAWLGAAGRASTQTFPASLLRPTHCRHAPPPSRPWFDDPLQAKQFRPHHNVGGQRGVGDVHVGGQGRHGVGEHCTEKEGEPGQAPPQRGSDQCCRAAGWGRPCSQKPTGSPSLTNAGGEGEEVDQPEEGKGALQLQRPPHDVGCGARGQGRGRGRERGGGVRAG